MADTSGEKNIEIESRFYAVLIHLSALACFVISMIFGQFEWIGLGSFIVPFVIGFSHRDDAFVRFHWIQSVWYVLLLMLALPFLDILFFKASVDPAVWDSLVRRVESAGQQYHVSFGVGLLLGMVGIAENMDQFPSNYLAYGLGILLLAAVFAPLRFSWHAVRGRQDKFRLL